jgi:hypothetical protein
MRVFVQDYKGKPEEYTHTFRKTVFYTDDGLYLLKDHKMYKQQLLNNRQDMIPYRQFTFLVDYTSFEDGDPLYHIPYKHRCCEEEYSVKDLGQGLQFVRKQVFDQISYYFEMKQLESFMFPKMFTFLM